MSFKAILPIVLGIAVMLRGLWILFFRPDPPPGAKHATRASRRIIAIGAVLIGALNIFFQFAQE